MKKKLSKGILQFIAFAITFFTLTEPLSAQRKCHKGTCPPGYFCAPSGFCFRNPCRACMPFVTEGPNEVAADTQIDEARAISIKIYDIAGRLVRTLADENMQQNLHELTWDQKDEKGNSVNSGIYVMQLNVGSRLGIRRLAVVSQ